MDLWETKQEQWPSFHRLYPNPPNDRHSLPWHPRIPKDIVDHIDTNKTNNRPENLRWIPKLLNMLNPRTQKKLELLTGLPIEEILKDMSILGKFNVETLYSRNGDISLLRG